jgi:hypothetical protein
MEGVLRLPPATALEPRLRRLVPAIAAITVLLWAPLVLRARHSWDDADPEILNNAYRLSRGEPLYRTVEGPPWNHNPYTPLYLAVVAAGLRMTGLSYTPARLVTFLATLAVAAAIVLLARRWRLPAREGAWAFCLLALVPAFLYNAARPHPQMLAVALSVWSFLLFESPRPLLAELASPLLAVLAVYTKQTHIALPLALSLWLLRYDRARLPRYAGAMVVLALVPALAIERATQGAFSTCVFGLNLLPYSALQIAPVFIHQAGIAGGFIALALVRLWHRLRTARLEPLDLYLAAVLLVTVPSLGRAGAHGQYVLELLVVTVVYLLRSGGLRFPAGREALGAAQLALVLLYAPAFVLLEEGPFARASIAAAPSIRSLIETRQGPVLSQQGSFSLFTRGEIHVQLFDFTSFSRAGLWDQAPLLREVAGKKLSWVVTEAPLEQPLEDPDDLERFTPELHEALARCYQPVAHLGPYYVYRPR